MYRLLQLKAYCDDDDDVDSDDFCDTDTAIQDSLFFCHCPMFRYNLRTKVKINQ